MTTDSDDDILSVTGLFGELVDGVAYCSIIYQ